MSQFSEQNEFGEQDNENEEQKPGLTSQQQYNVVSDTVTGLNVRLWDNLIQAAAIGASIVIGAIIGAFVAELPILGAIIGSLLGLLGGLFLSGIVLMIYRGRRHMRGRHD